MQLNKYIAQAGVCSRRKAAELVKAGAVSVNGQVVKEPGYAVKPDDQVTVSGAPVVLDTHGPRVYILLNKPKDYITTTADEKARKTVLDLIGSEVTARIFPVGRLDRATTGLLLLTNDGDLAQILSHPRYTVAKIYHVAIDRPLTRSDEQSLRSGVALSDGTVALDDVAVEPGSRRTELLVELHSGKYRVVRRLFEALGYKVKRLDRIQYAVLTKKGLRLGQWRFLSPHEVKQLYALGKGVS